MDKNKEILKISGNMREIPMDNDTRWDDVIINLEEIVIASGHYVAYTAADNILENLIGKGGKEEDIVSAQRSNWCIVFDALKKEGYNDRDIEEIHNKLDKIADGISDGFKL